MDKMTVRMPVAIKAKVTETLKTKIIGDLQKRIQQISLELEQFEFTAKRAIVEQENQDDSLIPALQQQIEVERSKRVAAKQEAEAKLKRAEKLEYGAEIGHGQLERTVELEIGTDALTRLGCEVTVQAEGQWSVVPPSHRFDMAIYQDLIEEVARIHGYDNIQISLPVIDVQLAKYQDQFEVAQLRQTAVTLGYQEAISFSFADAKLEKQLNPAVNPLALANPISSDLAVMRSTLLSSLIPCVQYNVNRQQNRVRFFELGLRFDYQHAASIHDLKQIPTLALIAVGAKHAESWHAKAQPMDFFDFKGDIEEILAAGRVQVEYVRSERTWLHPGQSAEILVDGQSIGYFGRLHPSLEDELDLGTAWVAELDQTAVLQTYVSNFTELSRFPSVRRDIALLISDKINVSEIQQLIEKTGGALLDSTWLFDVYTGQGVEQGKRSLAFALLWQHPTRTLEDAEIKSGMDNILQVLENTYQATLRAS